ncbi:MAG: site-specific DNA-methyltransferase [Bacteroidia bacterium]
MPTLHWIGKEKVINHHMDVPYKVLEHVYGFSNGTESKEETKSGNKIIHGDNLEALKALLPEYEGKIKCICIDPPYNTGTEHWRYNDNVSHPKILKWLKEVVGKEGDDLTRHDKWLCMMYPRLQLLHKLLAHNGLIFINIDDNEYHNLVLLTDEIFGIRNKLSTLIWDLGAGTSAGHFTRAHEYIVVYAKDKSLVPNFEGGEGFIDDRAVKKIGYKNPSSEFTFNAGTRFDATDGFELTGTWGDNETIELVKGRMVCEGGKLKYDVTLRAGYTQKKQMKSWFAGHKTFDTKGQEVLEFYFRKNGKIYCRKKRERLNPPSVIRGLASSKTGSSELIGILGKNDFDFPKPSDLIKFLIGISTKEGDTVLDSFAGSGSTGHAVLKLSESGERKFILIQMSEYDKNGEEVNICSKVTAERIKKVIVGYGDILGTGGSFDFYELGQPMFLEDGSLNELVGLKRMREYIFYTETKTSLVETDKPDNEYFLGKHNDTSYYFNYDQDGVTALDHTFLSTMKTKAEQYVIYADNCLLTKDFMAMHNIIFKKIPRDITRF